MAEKAPFPYKTEPFGPYQREDLRATWAKPYHFFQWEQGLGKSWIMCNTALALYLAKKITGMIVLAPNNVHTQWAHEQIPTHLSDVVPWTTYLWESGVERGKLNKRLAKFGLRRASEEWDLYALAKDPSRFPILIVNSEAVTVKLAAKAINTMLAQRRCLFVVDESGDFTKPSGARTKRLMTWRALAPYRRCLDGTPMSTSVLELYAPYRFLSPSIIGANTFKEMKEEYAEWETYERGDNGREFSVIARNADGSKKWKNLDQLYARIKPHTSRRTKAEVLPWLPKKQYHKRFFSMTPEQWRLTTELLENEFTTLIDGGTVTVMNKLTMYLRLQQIACGYVPPDIVDVSETTEPVSILPGLNPRLEAAVTELLKYNGAPTIVWTRFHFDIDLLAPRLEAEGFNVVTYDGRTSQAHRDAAKEAFQNGSANVFLGNPAAGGRGLNLFRAQKELFYANYFGYRRRAQAEDRGHRIGTLTTVDITDLLGARTIDMTIVKALRENRNVSDQITGDPAMEWI